MFSPYQYWFDLASLLFSPRALFVGGAELALSWVHTRNWKALLFLVPFILFLGYAIGCSVYLRWLGPAEMIGQYWTFIEEDSAKNSTLLSAEKTNSQDSDQTEAVNSPQLIGEESISPISTMLLLKVRQLEPSDQRASYLIGSVVAQQGRVGQARQIMRRIAPEDGTGFPAAYAWLAVDRLQNVGVKSKRDLNVLMDDLAAARKWSGVQPLLLSTYADLLLRSNQPDLAIEVLKDAGQRDSRFKIKLAGVAKEIGRKEVFDYINDDLVDSRRARIEAGKASEQDFAEMVTLKMLSSALKESHDYAQKGLTEFPESSQLRRLLSASYMLAYEKASAGGDSSQAKMELLDAAMKSDSTNPAVTEKIAQLTAEGKLSDERLATFLRDQLAQGKATALTHLLLAIGHLKKEEWEKAIVHLELARALSPNSPIILNNLALCIARIRPEQLAQARNYIETALRVVQGRDAEILDSYGEILVLMKDYTGAIRAFEASLAINPERATTRQKLADSYRKADLPEMAEAVLKKAPKTTESSPVENLKSGADSSENASTSAPGVGQAKNPTEPKTLKVLPSGVIQKEDLVPANEASK